MCTYRLSRCRIAARNDIIIAWQPLPGTQTALTRSRPLNPRNAVAMELTTAGARAGSASAGAQGGIVNSGYWGISVVAGERYALSLYLRNPQARSLPVTAVLMSADMATTYASAEFEAPAGGEWGRHEADLESEGSDTDARLVVSALVQAKRTRTLHRRRLPASPIAAKKIPLWLPL